MADQDNTQGGFPQNQTAGQDTYSTTGDGHPPRPGERRTQEGMAGQGTGQMDDSIHSGGETGMSSSTVGGSTSDTDSGIGTTTTGGLGGGMGDSTTGSSGMGGGSSM